MKSIYLLMYKAEEGVLEIRAKDFHSNYMTAVDILDDDTYLGAEINYNLFTVRKNSDAAADEDRNRLEVTLGHDMILLHIIQSCSQHYASLMCWMASLSIAAWSSPYHLFKSSCIVIV